MTIEDSIWKAAAEQRFDALEKLAHKHDVREVNLFTNHGNGEHTSYTHQFSGPPLPFRTPDPGAACPHEEVLRQKDAEIACLKASLHWNYEAQVDKLKKHDAWMTNAAKILENEAVERLKSEVEARERAESRLDKFMCGMGARPAILKLEAERDAALARVTELEGENAALVKRHESQQGVIADHKREIRRLESEIQALKKHDHAGICDHPDYLELKRRSASQERIANQLAEELKVLKAGIRHDNLMWSDKLSEKLREVAALQQEVGSLELKMKQYAFDEEANGATQMRLEGDVATYKNEIANLKHEINGLQRLLGNQARMLEQARSDGESNRKNADRQDFVITKLTEKADLLHMAAISVRDSCGAELDHDMTREERRKDMHGFYEALKMIINQVTTIDQDLRHDRR